MSCRDVIEFLTDYVAGAVSEQERAVFESHLAKCPPCVAYLETYQITIKITRQLPPEPMPPQLVERLRKVLEENCPKEPPKLGPCSMD